MEMLKNTEKISISDIKKLFTIKFLKEDCCREAILDLLHPHGPHCPHCNSLISDMVTIENFYNGKRCVCKNCGKWFNALSKTILQNSQFSFSEIMILSILLFLGVEDKKIAEFLNTTQQTIRNWRIKLKEGSLKCNQNT